MTDTSEDLELFDTAKAEFPSKYDLKDRLVLIWVTGSNGSRKGANGPYDWYETNVLVLDDPEGKADWNEQVFDTEKEVWRDALVPSAVKEPQYLEKFQFSFTGMTARLKPRVTADKKPATFKPMLGRVNSRPNSTKGMAPPWSIAEPTAEEIKVAAKHAARIREISEALKTATNGGTDEQAFD